MLYAGGLHLNQMLSCWNTISVNTENLSTTEKRLLVRLLVSLAEAEETKHQEKRGNGVVCPYCS